MHIPVIRFKFVIIVSLIIILLTGTRFFDRIDPRFNWIPINVHRAYSQTLNAHRHQIPCRLAYALTIHKSQGQTIERCVIDLGTQSLKKFRQIVLIIIFLR